MATFEAAHTRVLRAKLGLTLEKEGDRALAADLFERIASNEVDFTVFFRALCDAAAGSSADAKVAALFAEPGAFHDWAVTWRARLGEEELTPEARAAAMRLVNPAFIPRNHRVEEMIEAAVRNGDFEPFETLAEGARAPLRRPAGACVPERAPAARGARAEYVLRDLSRFHRGFARVRVT